MARSSARMGLALVGVMMMAGLPAQASEPDAISASCSTLVPAPLPATVCASATATPVVSCTLARTFLMTINSPQAGDCIAWEATATVNVVASVVVLPASVPPLPGALDSVSASAGETVTGAFCV